MGKSITIFFFYELFSHFMSRQNLASCFIRKHSRNNGQYRIKHRKFQISDNFHHEKSLSRSIFCFCATFHATFVCNCCCCWLGEFHHCFASTLLYGNVLSPASWNEIANELAKKYFQMFASRS